LVSQASDVCLPGRRFAVVLLAISRFPVGFLARPRALGGGPGSQRLGNQL